MWYSASNGGFHRWAARKKEVVPVQPAQDQFDVGVIVGRFQVHELHQAHRDLIDYVCERHEKVIIFLGLSPLPVSTNNPLDFESRRQMLTAAYPEVNVLYIKDVNSDEVWSNRLDAMIEDLLTPAQSVVLYGGRDSFIDHYRGRYPTQELTQAVFMSGTAERKAIARSRAKASPEFRAGVIWASQSRFPTVYTTVDIAILDYDRLEDRKPASESWKNCVRCTPRQACASHEDEAKTYYAPERPTRVLLGRKPDEKLYRFIGGFADPNSESFEQDAKREVREESGLEVGDLRYLGSLNVDDWRYRNEPDGIRTMLFTAKYLHGRPTPGDDIEEVRWFDLSDNLEVVPTHRPLMEMLRKEMQ
jgi:bifunctional NMN adenylyltransferase/nudix hydrolase